MQKCRNMKEIFRRQNTYFLLPDPPNLLLDGFAGRIAKERSGGRITFHLSTSFHHGSPRSYITWGMNNRPVGGRSLTPSTWTWSSYACHLQVKYSPQITSWSARNASLTAMQGSASGNNVRYYPAWKYSHLKERNNPVTMLPKCPMFVVRLRSTTPLYRWPIGSLPFTCMHSPALH
jgi:hypothetical protein